MDDAFARAQAAYDALEPEPFADATWHVAEDGADGLLTDAIRTQAIARRLDCGWARTGGVTVVRVLCTDDEWADLVNLAAALILFELA